MAIEARDLDQQVSIRRRVETPDDMGGAVVHYETIAQPWANIRPMRGGERFVAAQVQAESSYVITIRQRADLIESDVIESALGTFDITLIKRNPRAPFIEIECSLEPAVTGGSGSGAES